MKVETSFDKKIPSPVRGVLHILGSPSNVAVLAGGAVRDLVMGETPHDWDIATDFTPEEVISLFTTAGFTAFATDKEASFGRCTVKYYGYELEITTFRTDGEYSDGRRPDSVEFCSMEEDAKRRDLTVNGLFMDVEGTIYDFVGGLKDAEDGIIRFIGDPNERIAEDPVRILRAIRFCMRFDAWTPEMIILLSNKMHVLSLVAVERIKKELDKIIILPGAVDVIFGTGLFEFLFGPELYTKVSSCKQVTKWHPEGHLLNHLSIVFGKLNREEVMAPSLYWTALMHDLGKPDTCTIKPDGNTSFHGHEEVSHLIAETFMTHFKFSNEEKEKILWLIDNHMRVKNVEGMKKAKVKRLIREPYIHELITFHNADDMVNVVSPESAFLKEMIEEYGDYIEPLVKGADLIERGMEPGPHFGGILRGMETMQLEHDLRTKEEVMAMYFDANKEE